MSLYAGGQDDAAIDPYLRYFFRGVDGLPLEPLPPSPAAGESGQEPIEDEQFDAYFSTYFPGVASARPR